MIVAIITAAGKGTRLQSNINKQFLQIYGKPILAHTIKSFQEYEPLNQIFIVIPKGFEDYCKKEIINKYNFDKVKRIIIGGETRQESVYNALLEIPKDCKIVLVHDGVRPLITPDDIRKLVDFLIENNKLNKNIRGVILASPAYETVKKIDANYNIEYTITRNLVCMAQTPQVFFYDDLIKAYQKAIKDGFVATDDASLVERIGGVVKVFIGSHENIKITTPTDLFIAELIMKRNGKK